MNQKVKDKLSLLTTNEIKDQLIKWEKVDTLSDNEGLVYDWMIDELMDRLSDDDFCVFCDELEEAGGF